MLLIQDNVKDGYRTIIVRLNPAERPPWRLSDPDAPETVIESDFADEYDPPMQEPWKTKYLGRNWQSYYNFDEDKLYIVVEMSRFDDHDKDKEGLFRVGVRTPLESRMKSEQHAKLYYQGKKLYWEAKGRPIKEPKPKTWPLPKYPFCPPLLPKDLFIVVDPRLNEDWECLYDAEFGYTRYVPKPILELGVSGFGESNFMSHEKSQDLYGPYLQEIVEKQEKLNQYWKQYGKLPENLI